MSRDVERYPLRNTTLSAEDDALWNWAQNARVGSRLSPGRMLNVDKEDVLVDISALSGLLAHDEQSVTAVTLRTQPFRVYTCHKNAVSADNLEQDLLRWNSEYA